MFSSNSRSKSRFNLLPIVELMDRAALHLKWPKIRFGNMTLVRLKSSTVMVKMGNVRRAWIEPDGRLSDGSGYDPLSENLRKFLQVFANDPVKYASIEGVRSGACSFCRKELTSTASVSVGYGPICAQKWGLPWGESSFTNEPKSIEEVES